MNTHAEYRRHSYRPGTSYSPESGYEVSQLAHDADPSLTQAQPPTGSNSRRVAWIRPTELAGFAGPLVGRGIDLQDELIRRARRTPKTATRAVRRRVGQSMHPERTTPREEGIGL